MKKHLLRSCKKTMSVFLAALMLLSSWVFVAPQVDAVTSFDEVQSFSWKLTYKDDNGRGMKNASFSVQVYGKNAYGNDVLLANTSIGSDSLNTTSERSICSGNTNGVYPYMIVIPSFRNDNTNDDCKDHWRLYVNNHVILEGTAVHDSGSMTGGMTKTASYTGKLDIYNQYNASQTKTYSGEAAAKYAAQYALNYNHEWYFYNDGGDCANFVSQCLYAGGMRMTDEWFSYDNDENGYRYAKGDTFDYTWIRANELKEYLVSQGGKAVNNPDPSDFSLGDALFYDFDMDGKMDHSAIVSEIRNGVPRISAHSTPESASVLNEHWLYYADPENCTLIQLNGAMCYNLRGESYKLYRTNEALSVLDTNDAAIGTIPAGYGVRVTANSTVNGITYGQFNFNGVTGKVDLSKCTLKTTFTKIQLDHSMLPWEVISTQTCTRRGYKVQHCSKCDYYISAERPAAHMNIIEATCTMSRYCATCGAVLGNPLGHSMGAWFTETQPTCTVAGNDRRNCTRYGCTYYETREIAPKGHTTSAAQGDTIFFGSYPQSRVTDSALLAELNANTLDWKSYNYYSGTGSYGTMTANDTMKYADVTVGGQKYRAVTFTQYRSKATYFASSTGNSYQDDNGYLINNVYWFRFDPIQWRILDDETGLIMSELLLDAQAFSNTVYYGMPESATVNDYYNDAAYTEYANDYATSSLRAWLTNDFYNTAFSDTEKADILTTALTNEAYSTSYSKYDSDPTNDNVFVLSYKEAKSKAYGFTKAEGTDYAKSQGLSVNSTQNGYWWLRSASSGSRYAYHVHNNGNLASGCNYGVADSFEGVRPAITIKLDSQSFTHKDPDIDPTCETDGVYGAVYCSVCGEKVTDAQVRKAIGHKWDDGRVVTEQTCTQDGTILYTCDNDSTHTYTETAPATGHKGGAKVIENKVDPTCETDGSYDEVVYCTNLDRTKASDVYVVAGMAEPVSGVRVRANTGSELYETFRWLFDDLCDTLKTYAGTAVDADELLANVISAISASSETAGSLAEALCNGEDDTLVAFDALAASVASLESLLDSEDFAALVEPIIPGGLGKWTYSYTLDGVNYKGTENTGNSDEADDITTLRQYFIDKVHGYMYDGHIYTMLMEAIYPVLRDAISDKNLGTTWELSVAAKMVNEWGLGDLIRYTVAPVLPTEPHMFLQNGYQNFFADYPAVQNALRQAIQWVGSFSEETSAWVAGNYREERYDNGPGLFSDAASVRKNPDKFYKKVISESQAVNWSLITGDNANAAWHVKSDDDVISSFAAALSGFGGILGVLLGNETLTPSLATGIGIDAFGDLDLEVCNTGASLYDRFFIPLYELLGLTPAANLNDKGKNYLNSTAMRTLCANALNQYSSKNPSGGAFNSLLRGLLNPILDWMNYELFKNPVQTLLNVLPGLLDDLENNRLRERLKGIQALFSIDFIVDIHVYKFNFFEIIGDVIYSIFPFAKGINGIIRALTGVVKTDVAPTSETLAMYIQDEEGNAVQYNGGYWLKASETEEYASLFSIAQKLADFMGAEAYLGWINANGEGTDLFNLPADRIIACSGMVCHEELSRTKVIIPATGHDVEKTEAKAATCTADGNIEYYTCKDCGKIFADAECACEITAEDTVLAALGHSFTQQVIDADHLLTAATCTDAAVYKYGCVRCDAISESDTFVYGEALGHDWDDGTPVPDSTCTAEGTMLYTCQRDSSHTYTSVIELKDHTPTEPVEENRVEATCTTDGKYDEVVYCEKCHAEMSRETKVITAAGHDLTKTEAVAATCTTDGNIEYYTCATCNLIFTDAACTTLTTAADTVVKALGHDYNGTYTVTKKATADAAGTKELHCIREGCSELLGTAVIPARGHKMGEWTVTTPATCLTDGEKVRACIYDAETEEYEACTHTETQVIYATGHALEKVEAKDAGCETEGNIEYYICTNDGCGMIFADENGKTQLAAGDVVIPATGHKSDYQTGDIVTFGSYPQSAVTDEETLDALNAKTLTWKSYNYYAGEDDYGTMAAGDYMKYADTELDGEKYRAVQFELYRPELTYNQATEEYSYLDDNGYASGTVYWFKYEPLQWRILDSESGLVMCESIIDAQPYNNKVYFDDDIGYWIEDVTKLDESVEAHAAKYYPTSSIREWLNQSLYETAFTKAEKALISASPMSEDAGVVDNVFLLSRPEARNTAYGFGTTTTLKSKDASKMAEGTDYAKAQGLYVSGAKDSFGKSSWSLRNFAGTDSVMYGVNESGVVFNMFVTEDASLGVRPAMRIDTDAMRLSGTLEPTCTQDGYTGDIHCINCNKVVETGETISKLGHDLGDWKVSKPATCEGKGEEKALCQRDGCTYFDARETEALGHNYVVNSTLSKAATCTEDGCTFYECTRNPDHTYTETIAKKEHQMTDWTDTPPETGCGQGRKERHCTQTGCDYVEEEYYAVEHQYSDSVTIPATCLVDGYTYAVCTVCKNVKVTDYQEALGHDFQRDTARDQLITCDADGIEAYTCSRCTETNDIITKAPGHSVSPLEAAYATATDKMELISSTPVTCGDGTGTVDVYQCTHIREDDGERCTYTVQIGNQNDHTLGEWYVALEETCENWGVKVRECANCEYYEEDYIPPIGHNYQVTEDTKAACGIAGRKVETCANCNNQIITDYKALNHIFTKTAAVAPTCTEDGIIEYYTCIRDNCGKVFADAEGKTEITSPEGLVDPKLGHDDTGDYTVITKASCTADGEKKLYCIRENNGVLCNELVDTKAITKRGHDFTDWYVVTAATCEAEGLERRDCKNTAATDEYDACAEYETRAVEALGHTLQKVEAKDPTCTHEGNIEYYICTADGCGKYFADSKGKTEITAISTVLPAEPDPCDESNGKHDWSAAWVFDASAKSHSKTCKNNAAHIITGDCVFTEEVTKEPTYTADGVRTYTCSVCGGTYTEKIEMLHHELTKVEAKAATCTENGNIEYYTCAECDKWFTDETATTVVTEEETIIPAKGHTMGEWFVKTAATTTAAGIERCECTKCDFFVEMPIDKLVKTKFTATFVADGKTVDVVEFEKGDSTLSRIPTVPAKDGFEASWEEFTLFDEDIIINADYKFITDDSHVEVLKAATFDEKTGEAVITLKATSEQKDIVLENSNGVPLDIVVIADQSGSMEDNNKIGTLKKAVDKLYNVVLEDGKKKNVDHRMAVVGFAMGEKSSGWEYPAFLNTNLLSLSTAKTYNNATNSDYKKALVPVNTNGKLNSILTNANNSIKAKGATRADYGFMMASNVFANNLDTAQGRKQVVIFLTDGCPTSSSTYEKVVADTTVKEASKIKSIYGATVYSIGLDVAGITSNKKESIAFMNYVSSNYPNAKSTSDAGSKAEEKYYHEAALNADLSNIFEQVVTSQLINTKEFDDVTLCDTVSSNFTLTTQQEKELRMAAIEKFDISNSDILIERNADGTTKVTIHGISPKYLDDNYTVEFTFTVSANETTLRKGSYRTNTTDAGIVIGNDENYESVFNSPKIYVEKSHSLAIFRINGEIYSIVPVEIGSVVKAPEANFTAELTFSGWDIPVGYVMQENCETFDATLEGTFYTVTWNMGDQKVVDTLLSGDIITVPDIVLPAGKEFVSWDNDVPITMPSKNLVFTAKYKTHVCDYEDEITKRATCVSKGEMIRTCTICKKSVTTEIPALGTTHSWEAVVGTASANEELSYEFKCSVCGAVMNKSMKYQKATSYGKSVSYNLYITDDNTGNEYQPASDGHKVNVSVNLYDTFGSNKNVTAVNVYRVDANGKKIKINGAVYDRNTGIVSFPTDHFCEVIFEPVYSCETDGHIDQDGDGLCDVCGEGGCELGYHFFVETVVAPTCVTNGYTLYVCSACGFKKMDNFTNKSGHPYKTTVRKPTCTEHGCDVHTCTVCGNQYTDNETAPLGHSMNSSGTCSRCGSVCMCMCHKSGFMGFLWKIVSLFYKLFGMNRTCACGRAHY